MDHSEHYDNLEQRNLICKDYESRGFRMLHDNYDDDWKKDDEPHGTLIFTNEDLGAKPKPKRDYKKEIDALTTRIEKLEGVK